MNQFTANRDQRTGRDLIGRQVEQLGAPTEGLMRGTIVRLLDVRSAGDAGRYVVEWEDGRRSRPLAHKVRLLP
jgi:hypothetical protein